MKLVRFISTWSTGLGLLALLISLPLLFAENPRQLGRGGPAPRAEAPRGPAMVERSSHGSIRHAETHVFAPPPARQRTFEQHQQVIVHRDREADVNRPRFWHGFAFGARVRALREGSLQLLVSGAPYFYDDGIYYQQAGDDYQEVYPPVGADIPQLPDGAIEIDAGNLAYYYAGGAFYVQQDDGFVIAPTPLGVTVPELPPGAIAVSYNNSVAYQFNGVYYQPVFVDGVTQYMTFLP